MVVLGYTLLILGFLIGVVGEVMFLKIAYRRSLCWFFGCLIVPFVSLIFLLLNFKETAKPFGIAVVGFVLCCLGGRLAGYEC